MSRPKKPTTFADELGPGFINLVLRRLAQQLASAGDGILAESDSNVPARATAIMAYIAQNEPTHVVNVADALGYTHPGVAKTVEQLEAAGLVKITASNEDLRKKSISLTRAGAREMKIIDAFSQRAAEAFAEIFEEIGVDLFSALRDFERALEARSLAARLRELDRR